MKDNRIQELQEWSQETGLELPMDPEDIIALEDEGMLVDLVTGQILIDQGNEGIQAWLQ